MEGGRIEACKVKLMRRIDSHGCLWMLGTCSGLEQLAIPHLWGLESPVLRRLIRELIIEFCVANFGCWRRDIGSAATSRGKQVEPATHVSLAVILLYVGLPNFCLDSWPSFALAGFFFFFFFRSAPCWRNGSLAELAGSW